MRAIQISLVLLAFFPTTQLPAQSRSGAFTINPAAPADLIQQINAILPDCSIQSPCTIHIPPGVYKVQSGTISISTPAVSILGDGPSSVLIEYSGNNFLNVSLGSKFTIAPAGRIAGFTLTCTAAGVSCIRSGSIIGAAFEDLNLIGPGNLVSGAPCQASTGFEFQNASAGWMERWTLRHIEMGGFCTGLHFRGPTGSGTASFGYGIVDGLWTNQGPGSFGIAVDAGADVYHVLSWTQSLNSDNTSTADEIFHVAGSLEGTGFGFDGEAGQHPITFAHLLPGARMIFSGAYRIYGVGVTTPTLDAGAGTFFIGPFSGDGGLLGSTRSAGTIPNFGNSSHTVNVYPVETLGGLEAQNPFVTAARAYVIATTPGARGGAPSAPFFVFDPGIPMCLGTLEGTFTGQSLSQATPVFCVDGSGSIVQANGATLTGPVAASGFREILTTPASSSAPCTPGQFTDDANFHYVCVAKNTWKRTALDSF